MEITSIAQNQHSKDFGSTDTNMEKLISSLSGGLAEIECHWGGKVVQFIHQIVNDIFRIDGLEYLTTSAAKAQGAPDIGMMAGGIMEQSQDRLCKSCINYLQLDKALQRTRSIIPKWPSGHKSASAMKEELPFEDYATRQLLSYAEKAEDCGDQQQHPILYTGFASNLRSLIEIL